MNGRDEKLSPPQKKEVRISDLQLAAYLFAHEYSLIGTEGTNHRRVFIFVNVPEDIVFRYYRGEDNISARKLFGAYRDLKGLATQCL